MARILLLWTTLFAYICTVGHSIQVFDLSYRLSSNTRHPVMFNSSNVYGTQHPRYATRQFCAEEEASTHLIAPQSIDGQWSVADIPPDRLIAPVVVIHFREDRNMRKVDVEHWEKIHSPIQPGSVVILDSGWASVWDDRIERKSPNPRPTGFDTDACEFLSLKDVYGIGVDSPYIDGANFLEGRMPCRRILANANIYVLQNVRIVKEVPETGAVIFVAPLKMRLGLASPSRIVAIVEK